MLGQIASFVDTLHLSYDEVVRHIPYRNLIIMQRDKLRSVYGEKMEEVSEEEFFRSRGKVPPTQQADNS